MRFLHGCFVRVLLCIVTMKAETVDKETGIAASTELAEKAVQTINVGKVKIGVENLNKFLADASSEAGRVREAAFAKGIFRNARDFSQKVAFVPASLLPELKKAGIIDAKQASRLKTYALIREALESL